jgi:hypothetical protein
MQFGVGYEVQAIEEVVAVGVDHPCCESALNLLSNPRVILEKRVKYIYDRL